MRRPRSCPPRRLASLAHLPDRDQPSLLQAAHAATACRNSSESDGGWKSNAIGTPFAVATATTAVALVRANPRGLGYLLKDRFLDVTTLVDALRSVGDQGTVLDPEVVRVLL